MKRICLALCAFSMLSLTAFAQSRVSIEQRVEDLLSQMTLREKIGQLNQYSGDWEQTGPAAASVDKRAAIEAGEVGSMLNVRGAETTRKIQEFAMRSRLRIPLIFAQDVIHGYYTTFPIPLAESASWDLEAIEQSARIAATEAAASGIHWTFAPMVDVARDPRWGRVLEGAGEDTYLGCRIAEARVRGFQGKGIGKTDAVIACAKHFAGYGAAQAGRDYNTTEISERSMREYYFPPFEAAIKAGVGSFMTSFNDLNGIPSSGNAWLFRTILRKEWGYSGIVVSDWGAIGELIPHGYAADDKEAAWKAMCAGVDIDMESKAYIAHLESLVGEGKLDCALIDEAVRRVLRLKFELGLFDDPYKFSDVKREKQTLGRIEHREAAKAMAEKSIVLLKNESQILPLDDRSKTIAIIGPLAKSTSDMKGAWSVGGWENQGIVSPYDGLKSRLPHTSKLLYAQGCSIEGNDRSGFDEALAVAKQADVVVMAVGENRFMTGEATSRSKLSIPGVQEELMRAIKALNKPIVVLLMAGRPLVFDWTADHADAILYTWWLGSEAGNAIAAILYGDSNPSAKLPMTFPRSEGQIPIYYNHKNTGRPVSNPANVAYKSAYLDLPNTPRYAFGYGLSYTTFVYEKMTVSSQTMRSNAPITIRCRVRNTGAYDGEEVVQLYVRDRVGSVTRPVRELKGFCKVFIPKGESREVVFNLSAEDLAFWNDQMIYAPEAGVFDLMIGGASDQTPLHTEIRLL